MWDAWTDSLVLGFWFCCWVAPVRVEKERVESKFSAYVTLAPVSPSSAYTAVGPLHRVIPSLSLSASLSADNCPFRGSMWVALLLSPE